MTRFIVSQVLDSVRKSFPDAAPVSITVRKTTGTAFYRNDTLSIPADLWGFSVTNDYRLHFFAGLWLFHECRARRDGEASPDDFVRNAGRAARDAIHLVASYERKDPLLEPLLVREYIRKPLFDGGALPLIIRDMTADSLRYRCLLAAAVAFRADSGRIGEWARDTAFADYAIDAVEQKPAGGGRFDAVLKLRNRGKLDQNVECFVDLAGSADTLLRFQGFTGDTLFRFTFPAPILKVMLDPAARLFDPDETGHAFVSPQFRNQRKVWFMLALLFWDLFSGLAAFGIMLVLGIFIHSLGTLFFSRHAVWAALYTGVLVLVKLAFPLIFYGFTLWGFVYPVAQISGMVPAPTLAACTAAAAGLVYWAFQKDGARLYRFGVFLAFIGVFSAVEPLFTGLFIFFKV